MNSRLTIVALATAAFGVGPASAQYGAPPPQQQQQQQIEPAPSQSPQARSNFEAGVEALTELQYAVRATCR